MPDVPADLPSLILSHLDWAGAVVGIAGAWYVGSQDVRGRWWGFVGFLASNVLLIIWAVYTRNWAIVAMQCFFSLTSLRGLLMNRG